MSETRENIAKNIANLRKEKKWTQAELAEKLNYSDKAISKWERGESTPDADCLLELAKLFNVTVDYFFYSENQSKYVLPSKDLKIRNLLLLIMACTTAITLAVVIFVFGCYKNENIALNASQYWVAFIYAIPICALFCMIYFSKRLMNNSLGFIISASVLIWGAISIVFFQMLVLNMNFWMIYLIGVPIQASIILAHYLRK